MIFVLDKFPTHIAYTKGKNPKFVKINYQNIYNGRVHTFSRAIMIGNLHEYIKGAIPEGTPIGENLREIIEVYTVINHDSISRRKSGEDYIIYWKKPVENYIPKWDIENLASIWSKVINDTLQELNYLHDDNITYIKEITYRFIPVEDLDSRKIIIKFENYE